MEKLYGLIGWPLGHSFSEKYFSEKFDAEGIRDCRYRTFPLEDISLFPELLKAHPNLRGINVTIPYKEKVMAFLDETDPGAEAIGAVNCILIEDGKLKGYNADEAGFRNSLLSFIGVERPSALILGTGGASKAVRYVLDGLGIDNTTVSRHNNPGMITYEELTPQLMSDHKLLVNTTPLGTFPNVETFPAIPYEHLTAGHKLFDLVYNPPQTVFLRRGAERGCATENGYSMLVGQAERSWEIWNGGK